MKALALLAALLAPPAAAQGAPGLVARLSDTRVEITTAFAGGSIFVFGAAAGPLGPGDDAVIVVARGPEAPFVVRRKVQVLGTIWLNGPAARFDGIPTYYAIAGTAPAWRLLPEPERMRRQLGLDTLPRGQEGARGPRFRAALLELKQEQGLWVEDAATVEVTGARLFSVRLPLPATVRPGDYQVDVLLVRGGEVADSVALRHAIERVGTAAEIARAAREQPALYGLACLALAGLAGWLGSVVFRRV